jgi:hypothetical protein
MRIATLAVAALAATLLVTSTPAPSQAQTCCVKPDNGGGTIDLPPLHCTYLGPMQMVNGLGGGTIQIQTELTPLSLVSAGPGGLLGGTVQDWTGNITFHMTGTGAYAGYVRTVFFSVNAQTHSATRTPFTSPQTFAEKLVMLQGQLPPGDPDFDLLRITSGDAFGMPTSGITQLTSQPGNTWAVDSFFDIFYRIDFVGHAPGPFAGQSGSTTLETRLTMCEGPVPTVPTTFGRVKAMYR